MKRLALLATLVLPTTAVAQVFEVGPYLQLVEQESAWVLWETDSDAASVVEFGPTEALGDRSEGSRANVPGGGWVHEVELSELTADTRYYYRAVSGDAVSEVRHFVTAPEPGAIDRFRFVAMSDMQHDSSNPDVFGELVSDGILRLFFERYEEDLTDALAMALIPGDLVENGDERGDWTDQFWPAIAPLAAQVPVYPVPGNHERNANAYFEYFRPPANGSPGFDEHWWWLDYANVRIIGLDSNSLFANPIQLDWLSGVLEETCDAEHIDFVVAQLHHPFRSELWTPGELPFTGEVIARMETFSTECGKPSAHLFGHTHGYSRGQSRDHRHLWVNVATAGGRIDHWDEYPQEDYPEFSVSSDEYGFVIFEVEGGDDPSLRLERISRGDESIFIDNESADTVEIRRFNDRPRVPAIAVPAGDANPDCTTFVASEFEDRDGDLIGGAHWQISESCEDFSNPLVDEWRQHENWYHEEDRQAGDDPTDFEIRTLPAGTDLCARVRYRDRALAWSRWSEPAPFKTGASAAGENLLVNPGAEDELARWTVSEGIVEALLADECDGTRPYEGERYFVPGGLCESAEYGEAYQEISLGLDWVGRDVEYGGYLRDWNGADIPAVWLEFRDDGGTPMTESPRLERPLATWDAVRGTFTVPEGVASVRFYMSGTRTAGNDNDSYIDSLWLREAAGDVECAVPERPEPPDPGEDVGPDAEPDVGVDAAPDLRVDADPDTPSGDVIIDAQSDAGDVNESDADVLVDGTDTDAGSTRVSGGRGCAAGSGQGTSLWLVVALAALVRRRRKIPD
jgi:uncharacterized protein (TIGR03382 family)